MISVTAPEAHALVHVWADGGGSMCGAQDAHSLASVKFVEGLPTHFLCPSCLAILKDRLAVKAASP